MLLGGAVLRLLADCLGFSGALGIQVIVSSLQEEAEGCPVSPASNGTAACRQSSSPVESLTVWQFLQHRMVAAVIILLASLGQGSFSQLSSHLLTVAGIRTRNALQVTPYNTSLLAAWQPSPEFCLHCTVS